MCRSSVPKQLCFHSSPFDTNKAVYGETLQLGKRHMLRNNTITQSNFWPAIVILLDFNLFYWKRDSERQEKNITKNSSGIKFLVFKYCLSEERICQKRGCGLAWEAPLGTSEIRRNSLLSLWKKLSTIVFKSTHLAIGRP